MGSRSEAGSPLQATRVFTGGKRAAQKALAAFVTEAGQKRTVGTSTTVGKLMSEYLASLERLGRKPATLETYAMHVKNHIVPALGSIRLDRLTTHEVDRFLTGMDEKGLAPATIVLIYNVLSGALSQAVDWGWSPTNVAKKARVREGTQSAQDASHYGPDSVPL